MDEDALRPLHALKDRQLRLHISLQRADLRLEALDLRGRSLYLLHQGSIVVLQDFDAVLVLLLDVRELLGGRAGPEDGVLYKVRCHF